MVKAISYTALHYGVDFLEYAIRSVIDHVDEHWCLYTPIGSHGSITDIPCPETEEQLYAAALRGAGDKLRWIKSTWAHEGYQRDSIHQYAPDADVILVVDADEIWGDGLAESVIEIYEHFKINGVPVNFSRFRIPMVHFWRSFYRAVLYDPAYPERVIFPKEAGKPTDTFSGVNGDKLIAHMGYAQRPEIVGYKQLTHGHRGEWRKDDWFGSVFMANAQTNCHPVGSQYWNPESVDPFDYMPSWMAEHPYAKMAVIE